MVIDGRASWPPRPTLGPAQNPLFPLRIRPPTPIFPVRPSSPRPQPAPSSTSPSRASAVSPLALVSLRRWQHPSLLAGARAGPAPGAPLPAGFSPHPCYPSNNNNNNKKKSEETETPPEQDFTLKWEKCQRLH